MKIFLKYVFAAIFAVVTGYSVYASQKPDVMSELVLANVEALASGEGGNGENQCYQVYTPADWFHSDQIFVDCYTCTQKKGRNFDISRSCYRN
jgi:hypothetical protein